MGSSLFFFGYGLFGVMAFGVMLIRGNVAKTIVDIKSQHRESTFLRQLLIILLSSVQFSWIVKC